MSPALFLVLALLTVASALSVVVQKNPVHAALGLVVTLFLLAVHFLALSAELIAMLQVIVYAGAIVVLFLFVIMLLNLQVESRSMSGALLIGAGGAGGLAIALLLFRGLRGAVIAPAGELVPGFGETAPLAERLFTAYLVPFELTSLLLLVAIVGAVAIAKRKP